MTSNTEAPAIKNVKEQETVMRAASKASSLLKKYFPNEIVKASITIKEIILASLEPQLVKPKILYTHAVIQKCSGGLPK